MLMFVIFDFFAWANYVFWKFMDMRISSFDDLNGQHF
jgi:hypothetical protein